MVCETIDRSCISLGLWMTKKNQMIFPFGIKGKKGFDVLFLIDLKDAFNFILASDETDRERERVE